MLALKIKQLKLSTHYSGMSSF